MKWVRNIIALFVSKNRELYCAACKGDIDKVTTFIEAGGRLGTKDRSVLGKGRTVAHYAAEHGQTGILTLVASESRAVLNMRDELGLTPLMVACESSQDAEFLRQMIQLGAEVNSQVLESGLTALDLSARQGDCENVNVLLQAGAKLYSRTRFASSKPLISAVMGGSMEMIKYLVTVGADVNERNSYGETPLMIAAKAGSVEMVQLLVRMGADVSAVSIDGANAADYAISKGHMPIADALSSLFTSKAAHVPVSEELRDTCQRVSKVVHVDMDAPTETTKFFHWKVNDYVARKVSHELHGELLSKGLYFFSTSGGLGLVAGADQFEVIRIVGTRTSSLINGELIAKLKDINGMWPFDLWGVGGDFVWGEFACPIHDELQLAQCIECICPLATEIGAKSLEDLAQHFRVSREFELRWD